MSNRIHELLNRNLQEVFGEGDAARRRAAIEELYTDDCVSDATWTEATRHFSDADIIHLIAAAGCYRTVSGFLNSAGVQLDDGVHGWPTDPRS